MISYFQNSKFDFFANELENEWLLSLWRLKWHYTHTYFHAHCYLLCLYLWFSKACNLKSSEGAAIKNIENVFYC